MDLLLLNGVTIRRLRSNLRYLAHANMPSEWKCHVLIHGKGMNGVSNAGSLVLAMCGHSSCGVSERRQSSTANVSVIEMRQSPVSGLAVGR